ncbi:SGNH/GDSL hydrolase family protein [Saccharopolyspora indica]|uniref:SGNH/GDSL hydrolase family protein n=1 Tax=Saccharopolyspora indica TaxID=1229659 RepID=UPI0022EA5887|nr:SGNH/GDSL hydrolase family protein [Saccharopolyspora indica]MDA3649277.1 SGNH/GDSL hydrolase family protein [Saccharopolyspora indica]
MGRVGALRRAGGIALSVLAGLSLSVVPAAADEPAYQHYVALGDSFTSGPLIPWMRLDPLLCGRSTNNYPALLARELGPAEFTDVSCGGADTTDMTSAQDWYSGPQFDALTPETDLVTLGIGGNDSSVFGDVIATCSGLRATDPVGSPCREHFAVDGGDDLVRRIEITGHRVAEVVRGVQERSPRARILVIGYPRIVPPSGYCPDVIPIADGDYSYADEIEQQLNAAIAGAAERTGVTFVDTYGPSLGHDACATGGAAWINGQRLSPFAAPYHPFASAMAAQASIIADVLDGEAPDVAEAERAAERATEDAARQAERTDAHQASARAQLTAHHPSW